MILVNRFGMPSWVELPAEVMDQLRLSHDLREDLVSLQLKREQDIAAVWSSYPDVAGVEAEIATVNTVVQELRALLARERETQRTRSPRGPVSGDLKAALVRLRELKQQRRARIVVVRDEAFPRVVEVSAEHDAAVKALYAEFVQGRGLYWACFNRMVEQHRRAARLIAADRAAGRHGVMRHRGFDGSGALSVQLQRQRHQPQRTPELLASGTGPWRNVFQLKPWIPPGEFEVLSRAEQGRLARGIVMFHVGRGGLVELPVIVHRMIPAGADVTTAQLVIRRVAGGRRVFLTVTARLPDPGEPADAAPSADTAEAAIRHPVTADPRRAESYGKTRIAVHFGWRRIDDDGTLRVATWRADAPVAASGVGDVAVADSDRAGVIILPGAWRKAASREADAASRRGRDFDAVRRGVVDWLSANPPGGSVSDHPRVGAGWVAATSGEVARWQAPRRMVMWARQMAEAAGTEMAPSLRELLDGVEQWRRVDRRRWEAQTHGRRKALGRRDDAWHRVAAWLAATAGMVVLDDSVLAELWRPEEVALPAEVVAVGSRQRGDAAAGRLRELIRGACARDGVPVEVVSHVGLSRTHAECGHLNPADDRYGRSDEVVCEGCGGRYELGRNATSLMLAASRDVES